MGSVVWRTRMAHHTAFTAGRAAQKPVTNSFCVERTARRIGILASWEQQYADDISQLELPITENAEVKSTKILLYNTPLR
jgi:hypothetical protein